MLRHAYCKAYSPVDSGTPPLGFRRPGATAFGGNNAGWGGLVVSRETNLAED